MAKLKQNWFYLAALVFAVALPFSEGLISTSIGLLLIASLVLFNKKNIKQNIVEKKYLIIFSCVFFVYVIWLLATNDWKWAVYDLQKNISYLIIPIAFFLAPSFDSIQKKRILTVFSLAVLISSLITFIYFYLQKEHSVLGAQEYGFIHHIRFSFQLIFAFILFYALLFKRYTAYPSIINIGVVAGSIFLLLFLIWHQSLTGLITLLGVAFIAAILFTKRIKSQALRISVYMVLLLLVIIPVFYLNYAVDRYYSIDKVNVSELDEFTSKGNRYRHDLDNGAIENGHYVWLYVCDKELEEAWNAKAKLKYNELDKNKYQVKYTLIRYLASKNLRKDAEGVNQLTKQDIQNIENGISNYILANRGLSLYPRIYVSIWEIDTYLKTGSADHRSLAQRIEYTKAALTIIEENFWFGVGTGNWKKAYADAYIKNGSKMKPERFGDAHNQYLNYMVKFGFVGLLIIMTLIFYPVIKLKAYKNPTFMLFFAIMLIGNFGDSNFETHVGSNFFVFFYCLLIMPGEKELTK